MPAYIELAGRVWRLRLTLRSALCLQALYGLTPKQCLKNGASGAIKLLYAALQDAQPDITPVRAAALMQAAAQEESTLSALLSALAQAVLDSGMDSSLPAWREIERLLRAARRAGYRQASQLLDCTWREACQILEDYLYCRQRQQRDMDAQAWLAGAYVYRALSGRRYPAAPDMLRPAAMTDAQMQSVLSALAERSNHDNA